MFDCVLASIKNVTNILIVYGLFHFIFSVVAVQLFSGRFYYCTDITKQVQELGKGYYFAFRPPPESVNSDDQSYLKSHFRVEERRWRLYDYNFDNSEY